MNSEISGLKLALLGICVLAAITIWYGCQPFVRALNAKDEARRTLDRQNKKDKIQLVVLKSDFQDLKGRVSNLRRASGKNPKKSFTKRANALREEGLSIIAQMNHIEMRLGIYRTNSNNYFPPGKNHWYKEYPW